MGYEPTELIWHNGDLKPWQEATTHVLSHGLHYGSSVFEGIRAYRSPHGPQLFRNTDHIERLLQSARLYRMELAYSSQTLADACRAVVRANGLDAAYVRPIAYRGQGSFAIDPGDEAPVEVAIAAIEWADYLGAAALENGIDACVSSWRRLATSAVPVVAKASGHYLNAQLIAAEAKRNGYAEGIALDTNGMLSEGSSENLFLVKDGTLFTPPISCSVLDGITRDSIMQLAGDRDIPVVEAQLGRDALFTADELFFTGTAAEITPIRSIDQMMIGEGNAGPITRALQSAFFGLFTGETPDTRGWLDPVYKPLGESTENIDIALKRA